MKLFKTKDGYASSNHDDFDDITAITNHELAEEHGLDKLSIKNCQAIENGYDLDELVDRAFDNMGYHSTVTPHEEAQFKLGYRLAFKEVLELMEGKKYSRQDVIHALTYGVGESKKNRTHSQILEEYKNSHLIQPKEWEVEISEVLVGECEGYNDNGCFMDQCGQNCGCFKKELNLDKNGCLILRRL